MYALRYLLVRLCVIAILFEGFADAEKHSPKTCDCSDRKHLPSKLRENIVFVLDTTEVVTTTVKGELHELIKDLTIGEEFVRIAIVNVKIHADFDKYKNNYDAQNDIKNIEEIGGSIFQADLGLEKAKELFDAEEASEKRRSAKNVVVLITARPLDCTEGIIKRKKRSLEDYACRIASSMRSDGITIITLPIKGKSSNLPKITLASPCFEVVDYENQAANALQMLCQASCDCEAPFIQVKDEDNCLFYSECVYPIFEKMNYTAAQSKCKSMNAALSDILSPQKEAFLDKMATDNELLPFWVGQRNNKWDMNEQKANEDYWKNGKYDPKGGECTVKILLEDGTTAWQQGSCDQESYFACQKYSSMSIY
uniref:C-type lectin domain-containing protein n=1 Tax=Syphacia muris TaxID=451379 RepID=A0A0N5AYJ6_9BILA